MPYAKMFLTRCCSQISNTLGTNEQNDTLFVLSQVRYNYGVFKFECLKETKAAQRLLEKVVKKDPDFCAALHTLAKVMMHKDVADYVGCYRKLKRCLELEPCNLEALCTQAVFQVHLTLAQSLCLVQAILSDSLTHHTQALPILSVKERAVQETDFS